MLYIHCSVFISNSLSLALCKLYIQNIHMYVQYINFFKSVFGSWKCTPEDGTVISSLTFLKLEFNCATVGVGVCVSAWVSGSLFLLLAVTVMLIIICHLEQCAYLAAVNSCVFLPAEELTVQPSWKSILILVVVLNIQSSFCLFILLNFNNGTVC